MSASASLSARLRQSWGDAASSSWSAIVDDVRTAKGQTAEEAELNRLWAVENLAQGMAEYVTAYNDLVQGRYYEGWCALERAEIAMLWSARNPFLPEFAKSIAWLTARVRLWQSIFPYRVFFSPGMRVRDWKCTICGLRSTPVAPCGHTPGRVYEGHLCSRLVTAADFLEISLVTEPVQKYSVCFVEGHDYDYALVEFVLERLCGPFHPWHGQWTHRRHPHRDFTDHTAHGPCPCDSSLRYSECCAPTDGVRVRHFAMEAAGAAEVVEGLKLVKLRPRVPTSEG